MKISSYVQREPEPLGNFYDFSYTWNEIKRLACNPLPANYSRPRNIYAGCLKGYGNPIHLAPDPAASFTRWGHRRRDRWGRFVRRTN